MIVVLRILRGENSRESVTSFNTVSLEVLKFVLFRPMQISPSSSDMKYLLMSFFTKKINKFFRKIFNHRYVDLVLKFCQYVVFLKVKQIVHQQSLASHFEIFFPSGIYSFTTTETELN